MRCCTITILAAISAACTKILPPASVVDSERRAIAVVRSRGIPIVDLDKLNNAVDGGRYDGPGGGPYVEPTLITNVRATMRVRRRRYSVRF
jgi:hypothetical protein